MPLIVTPGRLGRLAEFYHQLAAMMAAGMPLVQSLDQIRNAPPAHDFRRPLERILDGLRRGLTFAESLQQLPHWLPTFDLALIAAGEQSGRLDATCRLLADYYQDRAQLARKVISDLLYPVFLVHFAVLLAPLPAFVVTGNSAGYARTTLGVLAPIYLAVFFLLLACQGQRGQFWRALIEALLNPVPILGKARRSLALARLAAGLEALLSAGIPMLNAWPMAAAASGSPALQRGVDAWHPHLITGESPADQLTRTPVFPEFFRNIYGTGEISGTIDDALKRLHAYYRDDATRKLRALSEWVPRLVYLGVVAMIAVHIIQFWTRYYEGILNVLP